MGIPIDERQDLIDAGLDVTEVLTQAATLFFKGVFELGVFHGDQHAGNMFIKDDGRAFFVDFGIVGRIPQKTRFFLADLMHDLLERRYDHLAQRYSDEGYSLLAIDVAQFALTVRSGRTHYDSRWCVILRNIVVNLHPWADALALPLNQSCFCYKKTC